MRDGYAEFFNEFEMSQSEFFEFGIKSLVFADKTNATVAWKNLKAKIRTNDVAYIRGYGRKGAGSKLYLEFYASLLSNENICTRVT